MTIEILNDGWMDDDDKYRMLDFIVFLIFSKEEDKWRKTYQRTKKTFRPNCMQRKTKIKQT